MKRTLLSLLLLFVFAFTGIAEETDKRKYANTFTYTPYTPTFKNDGTNKKVRGVILMIGDGMGITQAASGFFSNNNDLAMFKLKNMGYVRTYSKSGFTTDSAASGTTYGCGIKTKNGFIGMSQDSIPAPNISEKIAPKGYVTGIITTDNLDGATPGAFFAHVPSRNMSAEILAQLSESDLDFFAGGNVSKFDQHPTELENLRNAGFTLINDYKSISQNKSAERLGLIANDSDVKSIINGRGDFLPYTTKQALDYLSAKKSKGFFLMVESSQIDGGGHTNDTGYTVTEVIDFDMAISEALKFADSRGDILVIITADHETGGMTMPTGRYSDNLIHAIYTTGGHTGMLVPVFAYGPHSQEFKGIMENTDIHEKIMKILVK